MKDSNGTDKIISMADHLGNVAEDKIDDRTVYKPYAPKEDPEIEQHTMSELKQMMKIVRDYLKIQEDMWKSIRTDYNCTAPQMRELLSYNQDHINEEGLEKDADGNYIYPDDYDQLNGLNGISIAEIENIFGENPRIFGVTEDDTIKRVKDACMIYYDWMSTSIEYNNINSEFTNLMDEQERNEMAVLLESYNEETDPEKKAVKQEALNKYYDLKYLLFLREQLSDEQLKRIVDCYNDGKKIDYWISSGRSKLKQLGVSEKFILEIANVEERLLPEEYHVQKNTLLLYFLNMLVYEDINDKNIKSKVISIVVTMDKFIRKILPINEMDEVFDSVCALEAQFLKYNNLINDNKEE